MNHRKNSWQPRNVVGQSHGQRQPPQPGAALPKMAVSSQMRKQPVAPPAYRPQPVPKVLQRKMASSGQPPQSGQTPRRPVAPPVYRPQQATQTLQPKTAHPAQQNRKPPVAPPVYRPQALPSVLQAKPSASPATARPVHSPNHSPRIVPPHNSAPNSVQPKQAASLPPRRPPAPTPPAQSVIQRYTTINTKAFSGKRSENGRYVTGINLSEMYVLPGHGYTVERSYRTHEVATIQGVDYEVWKPDFNVIEDCVAAMEEIMHGEKLKYGAPEISEYRDPIGSSKKRKAFGDSDSENRKRGKVTDLGEDADPSVLEGFVIARQGFKRNESRPQFHGAAVVAQDGVDDITLEATAPTSGAISRRRVQPVYDMYQRGKKGKRSFKMTYRAEYGKDATVSVVRPRKPLSKKAIEPPKSKLIVNY